MIKSGMLLGSGNVSIALLSLVRNVLIARLISVEDFGIASTLAITMVALEMTSNIGLERLIVQARDGDKPLLQSTAQAIQAVRGVLSGAILFFLSEPIAALFNLPEVAWAYKLMAVIPLIRGLAHFDIARAERDMRFLPFLTAELSALFLSTVAAILLALELGDYRAMLYALLLQSITFTFVSHLLATRPYRWAWNRAVVRRALAYGFPLLFANLLNFATFHGDRVIVGSLIGITELAWFSVAVGLTMTAATVATRTLVSFFSPQLARVQDQKAEFGGLSLVTLQAAMAIALVLVAGFAFAGPFLIELLYGSRYDAAKPLLVLVAAVQGVRIVTGGTSTIAMSQAATNIPMTANILRALMLPVAWLVAARGGDVAAVVGVGLLGETFALSISLFLLRRRLSLTLAGLAVPSLLTVGTLGFACLSFYLHQTDRFPTIYDALAQALVLVALLLVLRSMSALRDFCRSMLRAVS